MRLTTVRAFVHVYDRREFHATTVSAGSRFPAGLGSAGRVSSPPAALRSSSASTHLSGHQGVGRTSKEGTGASSAGDDDDDGDGDGSSAGVFEMSPDPGDETENTIILESTDCDTRKV